MLIRDVVGVDGLNAPFDRGVSGAVDIIQQLLIY